MEVERAAAAEGGGDGEQENHTNEKKVTPVYLSHVSFFFFNLLLFFCIFSGFCFKSGLPSFLQTHC